MKRLLLVLAVLVAAVAATTQYRISSGVADSLEMAKRGMAPFATLTYGDVNTTFGGTIEITDVTVDFHMDDLTIRADRLAFITHSPWVLLNLEETLARHQLPDQLQFRVDGLTMPIADIYELSGSEPQEENLYSRFQMAGCGGRTELSEDDLLSMGYSELTVDFMTGYRLLNSDMSIAWDIEAHIHGASDIDAEMVVNLPRPMNDGGPSAEMAEGSKLVSATVVMKDLGDLPRLFEFCADDSGMSVANYTAHHLDSWIGEWQRQGVVPDEPLVRVYRDYIRQPGSTITLKLEPFPALEMGSTYLSPDPVYLSNRLNPQLGTENTGLIAVGLKKSEPKVTQTDPGAASTRQTKESAPETQEQTPTTRHGQLHLASLGNHLRKDVRIILQGGRYIDGRILSVDGAVVNVQRHLHGGMMEMPVNRNDIRSVTLR